MLHGQLYTLSNRHEAAGVLSWDVQLNAGHRIFDGHFPDQPILPGVCMMQIVCEVLEQELGKKLYLRKVDQLKFLKIIDPRETEELVLQLKVTETEGNYKITASLNKEDVSFFKMSGMLNC